MPRKTPGAADEAAPDDIEKRRRARAKYIADRAMITAAREEKRKRAGSAKPMTTEETIESLGGLDALLKLVEEGKSLRQIALEIGVDKRALYHWTEATEDRRSALAIARLEQGHYWADMAVSVLSDLPDDATREQISKARELSQRYAWRAKMSNRGVYGDQQVVEVKTPVSELTDDQLDAEIKRKAALLGIPLGVPLQ